MSDYTDKITNLAKVFTELTGAVKIIQETLDKILHDIQDKMLADLI